MAEIVPPLPYKTPMVDQRGIVSEPWSKWFRQLFQRIGGTEAPSNSELGEVLDLSGINADIAALEITTAGHTTSINTLNAAVDGLNQGRQL